MRWPEIGDRGRHDDHVGVGRGPIDGDTHLGRSVDPHDLGTRRSIAAAILQGDNNDSYVLEVSDDGVRFDEIWVATPVGQWSLWHLCACTQPIASIASRATPMPSTPIASATIA